MLISQTAIMHDIQLFLTVFAEKWHSISLAEIKDNNKSKLEFFGKLQDAEGILLQGGLTYRAILLNVQLFNWDRSVGC